MRWLLRSKIHNATVTQANPDYVGSITNDGELMDKVGLWPGERVMGVSNTSGARLETYVIRSERNSGAVELNGAAVHLIKTGESIIIMGFELSADPIDPNIILVDEGNKFDRYL